MIFNRKLILLVLNIIAFFVAFLGIIWLYKNKREGLSAMSETAKKADIEKKRRAAKDAREDAEAKRAIANSSLLKPGYEKKLKAFIDADENAKAKEKELKRAEAPPPPPLTAEIAGKLSNSFADQMADAGVPMPSEDEMSDIINQFTNLIAQEVAAARNRQGSAAEGEATTPVENTVAPVIPFADTTFFTGTKFGDAFCPTYGKDLNDLNNKCSILTSENCNATDCCIWVNGNKCIAGNAMGPSDVSGNKEIDHKYYSYKYQCYGNCDSYNGGGGGGGSSGYIDPCSDSYKIVPIKCNNDFWDNINCPTNIFPMDLSVNIPVPGATQYNFIVGNGNIDISHIPDMTWGKLKKKFKEALDKDPNLCITGLNPPITTPSTQSTPCDSSASTASSVANEEESNLCSDLTTTMIPIQCINQFSTKTNCPYFNIPTDLQRDTFPISIGSAAGNVNVSHNKVNMSRVIGMNWGRFKTSAKQLIQQNPGVCAGSNYWSTAANS